MSDRKVVLSYGDVSFGDELPELTPDVSMPMVRRFGETTGMTYWRFTDHEKARAAGLPGAIVPGIMSQGILVSLIHRWAPDASVLKIDTIFRAPVVVDSRPTCRGVVTDMDDEKGTVELDLTLCNEEGETRVLGTALVSL
ncbi:MAG: MaoC/PaaZ C-terminal domain-containing protein [Myxococcota bacterium]|jgi:acyl dehydratase|nr:MaoC/PaaZ C-terminal domain-containing protein [Myxococcota bacterium]